MHEDAKKVRENVYMSILVSVWPTPYNKIRKFEKFPM